MYVCVCLSHTFSILQCKQFFCVLVFFCDICMLNVCVCAARNSAKKPRSSALSEATNAHATQVATKLNSFQLHFATFLLLYMLSFKYSMTFC